MAGVYIKGIKVPAIVKVHYLNGRRYVEDPQSGEWREMVEIPPHGRLIDADALDEIIQEEISKDYNKEHRPKVTWSRAFELFEDMVLDAPTVIPADQEADNG